MIAFAALAAFAYDELYIDPIPEIPPGACGYTWKGLKTNYDFDAAGRLIAADGYDPSGVRYHRSDWTWEGDRVASEEEWTWRDGNARGHTETVYEYDARGLLAVATETGWTVTYRGEKKDFTNRYTFEHDTAGRIVRRIGKSYEKTWTRDEQGRVTSAWNGRLKEIYTYEGDRLIREDYDKGGDGTVEESNVYKWDGGRLLEESSFVGGTTIHFYRNAKGACTAGGI